MNLTLTTPAANPALTAADARAHLRTASTEDTYLEGLIAVATAWVEAWLGRALVNRTYTYKVDGFPGDAWFDHPPRCDSVHELMLPYPPLASVTSIQYQDESNVTQTLSSSVYELALGTTPGRVRLKVGQSWPGVLHHPDSVTVTYVAGYGPTDESVPTSIKHALRLLVGHLYEHREASSPLTVQSVPYGIEALLMPFRCFTRW
jgi:uncharacterized phiE125 gp8 family phage protein